MSALGVSQEHPETIPGALQDTPERSKGAPEWFGSDLGSISGAKWHPNDDLQGCRRCFALFLGRRDLYQSRLKHVSEGEFAASVVQCLLELFGMSGFRASGASTSISVSLDLFLKTPRLKV